MAWTKHLSVIKTAQVTSLDDRSAAYTSMTARTASWLNIAYQGNPQRIPRYYQFQEMDNDSDINTALDTIADFCTQSEEQVEEPFEVTFNGEPNESEVKIIKQMLSRWIKLNNLRARLWYMFRDTIKNGDAFFLRDPETQEWLWLDHFMVELVKVDESKGKIPDEYIIRGLDYNRQAKFETKQADPNAYRTPYGTTTIGGGGGRSIVPANSNPSAFSMAGTGADQRQRGMQGPYSQELSVIDAQYVVHLSLSIGNDINWPFGSSILEPIFKTYKQKELLEDAIIIYRVQRAPERRIFYIDVGTMPPERAKRHLEMIKNDIHQRRIPNRCLSLDTKIFLLDGRLLPLSDVITEHNEEKQNWVYSCNPESGTIVPGKITWAGETKKQTDVVKLTLDNGETIVCTPDHAFPIIGKGFVKAENLMIGESFIPLYLRDRNHKLISIEKMEGKRDTGTITVDGDEIYHSYHTFAIQGGVFTKNSGGGTSILDTAYNPLSINDDYFFACLRLSEKIILLDGRRLTLQEIIDEHSRGIEHVVLSYNLKTRKGEPGRVTWAGVTRRHAVICRVTLDNGDYVDATPDHRFIAFDGQEIAAGELVEGQCLCPDYRVVSVKQLPNREDTGDITIETASGSHIFALAAGIFVHNSTSDGRGSKVETLPGGDGNNNILDLSFFSKKLARGLRVPTSYLNIGEDEATNITFNDGKLGAAMIQEFRFSKYCMRLQSLLVPTFDKEFKRYLLKNGIEIEPGLFELQFNPPQSFTRYRQIELDSQRIQVYQGVAENKKISERYKLKRYLGWSEDDIIENEEMWAEENADKMKKKTGASPAESGPGEGLSSVGIHPGEDMGMGMPPEEGMPEGTEPPPTGGAAIGGTGAPAPGGPAGAPPAAAT